MTSQASKSWFSVCFCKICLHEMQESEKLFLFVPWLCDFYFLQLAQLLRLMSHTKSDCIVRSCTFGVSLGASYVTILVYLLARNPQNHFLNFPSSTGLSCSEILSFHPFLPFLRYRFSGHSFQRCFNLCPESTSLYLFPKHQSKVAPPTWPFFPGLPARQWEIVVAVTLFLPLCA